MTAQPILLLPFSFSLSLSCGIAPLPSLPRLPSPSRPVATTPSALTGPPIPITGAALNGPANRPCTSCSAPRCARGGALNGTPAPICPGDTGNCCCCGGGTRRGSVWYTDCLGTGVAVGLSGGLGGSGRSTAGTGRRLGDTNCMAGLGCTTRGAEPRRRRSGVVGTGAGGVLIVLCAVRREKSDGRRVGAAVEEAEGGKTGIWGVRA